MLKIVDLLVKIEQCLVYLLGFSLLELGGLPLLLLHELNARFLCVDCLDDFGFVRVRILLLLYIVQAVECFRWVEYAGLALAHLQTMRQLRQIFHAIYSILRFVHLMKL